MNKSFFKYASSAITMIGLEACMATIADDPTVIDVQSTEPAPEAEGSSPSDSKDVTANALSDCPANFFCLWENKDFGGVRRQFQDTACQNLGNFGFNDVTSSWFNRNSGSYRVYRNANCGDLMFVAQSGARVSDLVGTGTNDQASSICRPPARDGGPCP